MHLYNQNNNYRYPTGLGSSQNFSSFDTTHNAQYLYYNPRSSIHPQAFHEYQYSNTDSYENPFSFDGSSHNQSSSFLPRLWSPSANTIGDLAPPLSIFDEINPSKHRPTVGAPSFSSTYVPTDLSRISSVRNGNLTSTHVFREQLLTDIQRSIHDIDRDLTLLERQSSIPHYVPSRFSPLTRLDLHDDHLVRRATIKSVHVSPKEPIPPISPSAHKQGQPTSKETNNSESKIWPNRAKRIYEVIPDLKSDSRKTFRQSTIDVLREQPSMSKNHSPKTLKKNTSSSNLPLNDKYRDTSDIESLPSESNTYVGMQETSYSQLLDTNRFLQDLSVSSPNDTMFLDSEYRGNTQITRHRSSEDLILDERIDADIDQLLATTFLRDLTPTKGLTVDDNTESFIQTIPDVHIESDWNLQNTMTSHELYQEVVSDLINHHDSVILPTARHSHPLTVIPGPIDDLHKKYSFLQTVTTDSFGIAPTSDFIVDSDKTRDGEDDQNHFNIPTSAEIITDDDTSRSELEQPSASSAILFSMHVPQQRQAEENRTSTILPTIEKNNRHVKIEEKEEIRRKKFDVTKKPIATTTSISPASSPSFEQVLPTSIIDGVQTQFICKNNRSKDNYSRKPSNTILNIDAVDLRTEEQQKRSNNSQACPYSSSSSLVFQMHSRIEPATSERSDTKPKKSNEEIVTLPLTSHTSLKNIDQNHVQQSERINSADHEMRASVKALSRSDSSARTPSKGVDGKNSVGRKSISRRSSIAANEQHHSNRHRDSPPANDDLEQSMISANGMHKTPTNDDEDYPDNKSQRSHDSDQRSLSDRSISQRSVSGLSSSASSALPVNLDSSDIDDHEQPALKAMAPKTKNSASSTHTPKGQPRSPTSTDKPVPDDPSITNNKKHSPKLSSHKSNRDVSASEHKELPNQLLQTKDHSHQPATTEHHSSSHKTEHKSKNELPTASPNHKPEERSKSRHQQKSPRQSPPVSPSVHHQDLVNPTSLSTHEHNQQHEKPERMQKDLLSSVSPSINEIKDHRQHPTHQKLTTQFEHHETHLPSTSSHRDELLDTNHTSIKDNTDHDNINNRQHQNHKQTSIPSPRQPTFATEVQQHPSSENSVSSLHSQYEQHQDEHSHHKDRHPQPSSSDYGNSHSPSSLVKSINDEEEIPPTNTNHRRSKASHRERHQESSSFNNPSTALTPIDSRDMTPTNDDDNDLLEEKSEERQHRRRRVSFSGATAHSHIEEQRIETNWRERVASILASKHNSNEKYAYVQARVNSFENFAYHPRKFNIIPKKKSLPKHADSDENKSTEQHNLKLKKLKGPREIFVHEQNGDEQHLHSVKDLPAQMFGRLMFLPDGSPTIFSEPLEWHSSSKLKDYLHENFHYTPRRHDFKIFNKKPRWHSESKLQEFVKESPRFFQQQALVPASSLPSIHDNDQPYFNQQPDRRLQHSFPNNRSYESKPPNMPRFDERTEGSKLRDRTWDNMNYKPTDSKAQMPHKSGQLRPRSPLKIHPSRTTLSNGQIFDEKLNWNAQAKVHCWSELDLRQLTKKQSAFAQYHHPQRNHIGATHANHPKHSMSIKMNSDRPVGTRDSALKGYIWENFNYKPHRRTRKTPANKPKWNAVSQSRSVNTVYNPKVKHTDTIRRGRDRDAHRKRVNKLPPLKRKREHEKLPQLPSSTQLAIDYDYDRTPTSQEHTHRNDYAMLSSRRSSKALIPINHAQRLPDLELPNETPRSHRPIQQEWYEERNKSRLTHGMDTEGSTNHSFLNSITPVYQSNTPRELVPYRSTPRNSQNSSMSGTLLDSSIRTNRATEIRLSKNMDEHHQHCHHVSQSMPLEIRGFELAGTQCTVPGDATIRPLSNVNYQTSERVKNHRMFPWSMLHAHGTSSRNSSLLPIAEFRRTSLDTTITETQH